MTLAEACEAAAKGLPVIYKGVEYKRITEAGYRFNEKHERTNFVQLLSARSFSVIYADPAHCALKGEPNGINDDTGSDENTESKPRPTDTAADPNAQRASAGG